MRSDEVIYLIPYVISFLTSFSIGVYSWRKRSIAGATPFSLVAFSQAFWTFGYIFELITPDLGGKLFWDNLEFIGTVAWPFAFLAFAEQYTGKPLPGRRYFWPLLIALGLVYMFLVFTDGSFHFIRRNSRLLPGRPFDELTYDFTWVTNVIFLPYTLAVFGGFYLILQKLLSPHLLYRAQVLTVSIGLLIPFVGIALTLMGYSFSFHRDTSPFTFAIGNVIVAFGMFYFRMFEIVPIGRDLMFDSLSDMVFVVDDQDRLVDLNPATSRRLGVPQKELIGKPAEKVFAQWSIHFDKFRDRTETRQEVRMEDGKWAEIQIRPVLRPGGRLAGRLFVVREVTAQKEAEAVLQRSRDELEQAVTERTRQLSEANEELRRQMAERQSAEKALRESEDRFKRLFELSAEAQFIGDETSTVVDCNQAFLDLFAMRDKSEAIGHTPYEFAAPIQPDGTAASEMGRKIISSVMKNGVARFEWVHLKHDEKRTPVPTELILTVIPIQGRPLIHVAIRDVTQRKQLEEQLRQAQKMEAVGQLAGGVAHDFNNQLTIMINVLSMLKMGMSASDPQRHLLEMGMKASEQSAGLTRQLLAFSRRQLLEPKVLQLNEAVANLQKMLTRLIGEDIDLAFKPHQPLSRVKVDPVQIEQVIINLAVNARDAMPGGGKLTIETGEFDFDEDYARAHAEVAPGRYVMLAISDNGAGMDHETQARIFEPFFTTKERGKGTGLGLSMVYGIVKQCGGHIFVYSEPGAGSSFKLYFPPASDETVVRPKETTVGGLSGDETILLVEDNEDARETTRLILARHGFKVMVAASVNDALRIFTARGPELDLLITDVVMPGMSGRELANRFTTQRPDLKVLYVSGYTTNVIAHHGILDPGINYLEKPFSVEALIKKVRQVLQG